MKNGNLEFDLFIVSTEDEESSNLVQAVKLHAEAYGHHNPQVMNSNDFELEQVTNGSCVVVLHPDPATLAGTLGVNELVDRKDWAIFLSHRFSGAQYVRI